MDLGFLPTSKKRVNELPKRGSLRGPGISLKGFTSVGGIVKDLAPPPALVILASAGDFLSPWVSDSKYWALQADRCRRAENIMILSTSCSFSFIKTTAAKHPAGALFRT